MTRPLITLFFINCCLNPSYSQSKNFIDQPYIETIATVDTAVAPDEIYLQIVLAEEDSKGREPLEEVEIKLINKLKELGINTEADLQLTDFASNFQKYILKSQDILKTKTYTLRLESSGQASEVLVELEKLGISNISIARFAYTNTDQLLLELTKQAVQKAKVQATTIASALDQKLGPALYVSDMDSRNITAQLEARAAGVVILNEMVSTDGAYQYPKIEFEKIEVRSTLTARFKLDE